MGMDKLSNYDNTQFKFHFKLTKKNYILSCPMLPEYKINQSKISEMKFRTCIRRTLLSTYESIHYKVQIDK